MAVTIEMMEDTGAVLSGHGTTRSLVTNLNWKNSGVQLSYNYHLYPLRRPEEPEILTCSFTKYFYFKLSGTYTTLKNPRIHISGEPTMNTKLFYKMSNTYAEPSTDYDGDMMPVNGAMELIPNMNITGPENAPSSHLLKMENNTTYYTPYFVTQLRVKPGLWDNVGNTAKINVKLTFDEFEE
jgi:hypothetical protein